MNNWLKKSRERFLDTYHDSAFGQLFSAATWAYWICARRVTLAHATGLVLDAGSGRGSWKAYLGGAALTYESIEHAPRGGHDPTWIGDIQDMTSVPAQHYDTVICHQVLEHVPDPRRALHEFARVLKPDGKLIVSVPHLSRYHELPHDYYRYTAGGLRHLLVNAGFERVEITAYGGILCLLHHQWSFFLPGLIMGIPVIGTLVYLINAVPSVSLPVIDRWTNQRYLPLGLVAIASRSARSV